MGKICEWPILNLEPFPQIDFRHILALTDETAMIQHAAWGTPDLNHGYCTDDNARAAIAIVMAGVLDPQLWERGSPALLGGHADLRVYLQRYLAFLNHAFNAKRGRFRNFMRYDRHWREAVGSQDSHARALWALGMMVRLGPDKGVRELAERLFWQGLVALEQFEYLRPWSFGLLALDEYIKSAPDNEHASSMRLALATRLLESWKANASEVWPWWEDHLTWGNARLPHALLVSGHALNREDMTESALTALRWLLEQQTSDEGHLSIIGNQGWFECNGVRARFDQQPIEAYGLVHACLAAATITGEAYWADEAIRCYEWFTGRNDLGLPLYNAETGGCHDGLMAQGVNSNQGAESTLAYVLSVLELHHYRRHASGISD